MLLLVSFFESINKKARKSVENRATAVEFSGGTFFSFFVCVHVCDVSSLCKLVFLHLHRIVIASERAIHGQKVCNCWLICDTDTVLLENCRVFLRCSLLFYVLLILSCNVDYFII